MSRPLQSIKPPRFIVFVLNIVGLCVHYVFVFYIYIIRMRIYIYILVSMGVYFVLDIYIIH
jgi:hypothetical protein